MATLHDTERARRDGTIFGIPFGDLGWFQSILIGAATGMAAFFATTFLAIMVLLLVTMVTHRTPDFAIAYRRVGFPVGAVVMTLSLGYLGTLWAKRVLTRSKRVE